MLPVLDRHCVRCDDGSEGPDKSQLALTGQPQGTFSKSYKNLRQFVRWYEWGGQSIGETVTYPGRQGTDESPLPRILDDKTHCDAVQLSAADRERIYVWLDGNDPFYGTYREAEQLAQREGKAVPPPHVQ